jgi:hypothetical protein
MQRLLAARKFSEIRESEIRIEQLTLEGEL